MPRRAPGRIRSFRPGDRAGLELRVGVGVTEPYPRHWHDELQLCLATDGGGVLEYRGSGHETPRASLFVVPPGEVHANQTDDRAGCSFRSMYLAADQARRLASEVAGRPQDVPDFRQPVLRDADSVRRFHDLHRALELGRPHLCVERLLLELFAGMMARYALRPAQRTTGRERAAVRRAREQLLAAPAANVSLDELARVAGLSPFYLSRVFTAEVGMPPHAFQTHARILEAKRLIRAGLPLVLVAAATGFADQSHFTRRFKWLVKLTPGEYRLDTAPRRG